MWVETDKNEVTQRLILGGAEKGSIAITTDAQPKRIVLDTIEALFGELPNPGILRAEIRRLFGWLKEKGLTTVITAERDRPDKLTRHGIEEFVSDCVIVLDHRIREEISTRRLRVELAGDHAAHVVRLEDGVQGSHVRSSLLARRQNPSLLLVELGRSGKAARLLIVNDHRCEPGRIRNNRPAVRRRDRPCGPRPGDPCHAGQ